MGDEAPAEEAAPAETAPVPAPAEDAAPAEAAASPMAAPAEDGLAGEAAGEPHAGSKPSSLAKRESTSQDRPRRASLSKEVTEVSANGGTTTAEPHPETVEAADGDKVVKRNMQGMIRRASRSILSDLKKRKTATIDSQHNHDDADEKAEAENARFRMPQDFFYGADLPELLPSIEPNELPKEGAQASQFMGFDFFRHYNLVWTSKEEFAYITGHVVVFVNTVTRAQRYLHGRDDGGIGAVCMSPDMRYMAVGEKSISSQPNVYIYQFSDMKLYRILRKGTENGYASVQFSPHSRDQIATLGCLPDYLLSVWDWRNEHLLLKCRAYGQDIFNVRWGQFPGMLTTTGTGHIRFWKMATTFTGLKLQGDIGKFGATELSDIVGFVELPDGKVVTGSEYGRLLLWEGVFVKVELMRADPQDPRKIIGTPHEGAIDAILIDPEERCVISGGEDGLLRWWPLGEIDEAEADYDKGILEYGIGMKKEIRIPPNLVEFKQYAPAHIQHVARSSSDQTWIIQDKRNGVVWKFARGTGECMAIVQAHASQVTGTCVVERYPGLVLSSGLDGSLRAFCTGEKVDKELFADRHDGIGITTISAAPEMIDAEKRTVMAGYTDGTIRALSVCKDGFALVQCIKPHSCMVVQVTYSPDGAYLATLGSDNTIFFFEIRTLEDHAQPLGFVQLPRKVNHLAWHPDSNKVLCGLESGCILELVTPNADLIETSDSYCINLDYRQAQPELPELEDSEDEDDDEQAEGEGEGEGAGAAEGGGEDAAEPSSPQSSPSSPKDKKKKKKDEKDGEEEGDEEKPKEVVVTSVSRLVYRQSESIGESTQQVLFVGRGDYSGGLWELSLENSQMKSVADLPIDKHSPEVSLCKLHAKLPKGVNVTHLSISPTQRFIFIGFADGRIWAVPFNNMSSYTAICLADSITGSINSVQTDSEESVLLVGAGDGSLSTIKFNSDKVWALAEAKAKADVDAERKANQEVKEPMPEKPPTDMHDWGLPLVASPGFSSVARDITDPTSYSIEESKLKSEADNAKAAAEQKKRRVRDRIAEVREELSELQKKNAENPYGQLAPTEITIDQEYVSQLVKEGEGKVHEVRKELAWAVEYHERGLQKLRDHFLSRLDFERIEVLGFRSPHRVATFRCPSMSQELQTSLARLHELIFAAERESDDEGDGLAELDSGRRGSGEGLIQKGDTGFGLGLEGGDAERPGGDDKATTSGAEQRELRRQQRLLRKQQMQELERAKPSDSYEDPQDVEAIAHAEATLGNYMLKTSPSYQVPENQRMNAEKKRRQMFLLEESIHAIKTEFNNRVLALRDFRQQVCTEVRRDLAALREIDQQLGTETTWVDGLLDEEEGAPKEYPEQRFEHDEADLKVFSKRLKEEAGEATSDVAADEREASPEYRSEQEEYLDDEDAEDYDDEGEEEEEALDEDEEEGERPDGEGGAGSRRINGKRRGRNASVDEARPAQASTTADKGPAVPISGRSALAARRITRLTLRDKILQERGETSSNLDKAVAQEAQARVLHDKMQLEEHIRQVVDTFNSAVNSIAKEKAKLESDLKNADMKLLVLYEELLTLNELEERDEALLRKATKCRQDKTAIMHSIKECQDQLGEKKTEIETWHTEEQNLQQEFTELVGENSVFIQPLLKIYKKKVKRSKRKKLGEDEDFDDEEDEEEEESDLESDEDEDEMEDDMGQPAGCDIQIYESVLELREKRLDMEDALAEIQKAVEELKKTHKKYLEEEKRIDKEQKATDAEIQQFQTDKQRKLNQVPIVFALRLSQVQCLDDGQADLDASAGDMEMPVDEERLPPELNNHVVFAREGLDRLMNRIKELHEEIRGVKQSHKQLQKDFRLRKKEKMQAERQIEDLQAKFQDIQMLKFGQTVDLDLIERSAPNSYVLQLQDKAAETEVEQRRRLAEWDKKIEKQKRELAKITCDNTSLMEQIVSMGYSQMQLDAALNARIANVTVNDAEPIIELREMERERLKDLLALQSKEIATLQAEIGLFRKKGGHIYTTVTANRVPESGGGGYPAVGR